MIHLVVVAAFLVLVNAGRMPEVSPADIREVRHTAALLLDSSSTGFYSLACGGAIISETVVLTATVSGTKPSQWRVRVGSNQHNAGGQLVGVSSFIVHHGFNTRLNNDIALVYLDSMLQIGENVGVSGLPYPDSELTPRHSALAVGWGTNQQGEHGLSSLNKQWLSFVDPQVCRDVYDAINPDQPVTDKMVCFSSTCVGDSGGPVTAHIVHGSPSFVALDSWRAACNRPSVYTKVSAFVSWIRANQ